MTQNRMIPFVALTALIGGALLLGGCGGGEVEEAAPVVRPVKTLVVGEGAATQQRSFPGRVKASNQVDLSFRVGGPLVQFPAREGDDVRKGQLLARIDPRDFEIRISSARATLEQAEADYQRSTALYEKDAVSKAQLDQALAARDVAAAAVQDAQANLEDTNLRAPFAARVGETFVENFQDITPGQPVLSLVGVQNVDIEVDIPETLVARYAGRARVGRITGHLDAAPDREFELSVKEIAAQADPQTQTYRATLTMPQPEGVTVLPGMTATVVHHALADESRPIVVPAVAVFADEAGQARVWIVDPGSSVVQTRAVVTGELSGADGIEIVDGLAPGETIAVSGVSLLREGMEIRPVDEVRGL